MSEKNYKSDLTFDEEVMMALVRAAECFKRSQALIFKKHGLSFPQYNILRVLDASYQKQNKISVVGKIMLTPGANMTGLAKRLEQKNIIIRRSDPKDERVTQLIITEKGQRLLKLIEDEKNEAIDNILNGFSTEAKTDLLKTLKTIIKSTTNQDRSCE